MVDLKAIDAAISATIDEGKEATLIQDTDHLNRLAQHLDLCRQNRKTITYLEAADAIGVLAPQRIHQVTQLLEILIERDQKADNPIRAALVVSRNRTGLPGEGFFLKAKELGLMSDNTAQEFHQYCLDSLFKAQATEVK